MIQDIGKGRFNNQYDADKKPLSDSVVLSYRGREVLLCESNGEIIFPTYDEVRKQFPEEALGYRFLFSLDEKLFFWIKYIDEFDLDDKEYKWRALDQLRTSVSHDARFLSITGFQLSDWYESRTFCPRCGTPMIHDMTERMMRCTACGLMEYPKICPGVIVGVTDGDKLLLTKYAGRGYKRYALVAGFTEIGETLEETVEREVLEEVGLRVKNIRYYKSQPWSYSNTLLMGFFAEVDGDSTIHLDETELSVGVWCKRDQIPEDDGVSLTREMMRVFREGKIEAGE